MVREDEGGGATKHRSAAFLLYYEKLQFFVFPLALGFNGFNMQKSGWTRLIGTLCRQGRMVNKRHWIDLGAMILHYIVWMAIP